MKIMQVAGECFPYSKTGGLADMVGALTKALAHQGHELTLVTPLYRGMESWLSKTKPLDWKLELPIGNRLVTGQIRVLQVSQDFRVLMVDQPDFFQRKGIYGEDGEDYADNAERFVFFCKACVNLARYLPDAPDLIHAHDWQSALVPMLMHHERMRGGWAKVPPSLLTLHNLAYQGNFPPASFGLSNLPENYFTPQSAEFYGQFSFLKAGLIHADRLTTVSPTYAREILTDEFSCGLGGVLNQRADQLHGILNGVDYDDWQTGKNPHLTHSYDRTNMRGKAQGKLALQKQLGLDPSTTKPLFGCVSRLVDQKGMDILMPALNATLDRGYQVALLGSGMPHYQEGFERIAARFPEQVSVTIGYDDALAHRIEAGSDFFLMPSRFEPCGLNQMYSLRYGSIPIVRDVGGLSDSVVGLDENPTQADGIKFSDFGVSALMQALAQALELYQDQKQLKAMQKRGMARDFSWQATSNAYLELYREMVS